MRYKLSSIAFNNIDPVSEMAVDGGNTSISFDYIRRYQKFMKKGISEICKNSIRVNYDYVITSNINREYPLKSCAVNNDETMRNMSKQHSSFHTFSLSLMMITKYIGI